MICCWKETIGGPTKEFVVSMRVRRSFPPSNEAKIGDPWRVMVSTKGGSRNYDGGEVATHVAILDTKGAFMKSVRDLVTLRRLMVAQKATNGTDISDYSRVEQC